jgi:pilus assembly protein CpaC
MAARTQAWVIFSLALGMALFCTPQSQAQPEPPASLVESELSLNSGRDANVENRVVRQSGIVEETRTSTVGVQDILNFEFSPRSGMPGSTKILSVEANPNNSKQIIVTPIAAGTTSLTILDIQGKIRYKYTYNVTANDMSQKVTAIRELLKDIEGITVRVVDNRIVVDGELIVPRDYDRIYKVIDAYKADGVLDLVNLSRLSMEAIAKKMQEEINKEPGGVNITVRLANETFFLLGTVDNTADRDRAELIAKTYLPDKMSSAGQGAGVLTSLRSSDRPPIQNLIITSEAPPAPAPKMVRVTVHFVEIGKEFLKSSYFKWSPLMQEGSGLRFGQSSTGGITTSGGGGSFTGTISNLLPKIQAGSNGGFARILYSTVGLGLDGETIEIKRTDQIPVIETINGVPNTTQKDAGVSVNIKPSISGEDKVKMENTITIDALSGAGGSSGGIRKATSRISNQLIVRSGDSAVIGGLVSNDTAKDVDKDPEAAGAGSPLFTLLRSKAFRNKKTQFVIFISPKIISDAGAETMDIKTKIINNNKQRKRTLK